MAFLHHVALPLLQRGELAVVGGACWILITGIGELITEDVVTNKQTDSLLLGIISSLAAFVPAMLFLLTYRIGEPVNSDTKDYEMSPRAKDDDSDIEGTNYRLMHDEKDRGGAAGAAGAGAAVAGGVGLGMLS